ncbi:hypothetical protein HJG60_007850 [Phyllostomus discolor]|uniref:Uncharacterized protein n=1 Tax=Phyllostomus discolor TaxID=89673 RepID=A0A834BDW0_9CHIR|nr:hypothetical protein HJG60_007850 [Phyllostomus discolor]
MSSWSSSERTELLAYKIEFPEIRSTRRWRRGGMGGKVLRRPLFYFFYKSIFHLSHHCVVQLSAFWLPVNSLRLPRGGCFPVPPSPPWVPSSPLPSPPRYPSSPQISTSYSGFQYHFSIGWVAQLVGVSSHTLKGYGFNSQSGHLSIYLGCWFDTWLGHIQEATNQFTPLPPSLKSINIS